MKLDKTNPSIARYLNEGFAPGFLIREDNKWGMGTITVVATLVRKDGETRSVKEIPEDSFGIKIFKSDLGEKNWHIPMLTGHNSDLELTEPAGLMTLVELEKKVKTGRKIQNKIESIISKEMRTIKSVGEAITVLGRAIGIECAMVYAGKLKGKFVPLNTLASNIDWAIDDRG